MSFWLYLFSVRVASIRFILGIKQERVSRSGTLKSAFPIAKSVTVLFLIILEIKKKRLVIPANFSYCLHFDYLTC
jgi:hypothetical protein